ncbi:RNA-guided endonuclease InsQ/TnpB family protein [Halapricum desulfuricans]|uniref:Transposable element n=1 Tax=Halapricum desulfuricans TaxID=2841257 RepID=A0A897NND8_9EURY|nr:transposase [Halapricum desulfuricans]QSG07890.1 Transposable element [Halapricum desulfuricans]QSG12985.1 Transposable element [Halapricum desulfuricans]
MKHTLRFRAYLPDDVASEAWQHIDILRQIRNHAVRDYYRSEYNDQTSDYDQHDKLTEWTDKWPTFADPSQHAAQQAISQIHDDLETLQERRNEGYDVGRLRWQGAGEFRSVSYNQPCRWNVDYNTGDDRFIRLRLEKIGWFKIRAERDVPPADDIDEVILKKETTGEWYVSLVTTVEDTPERPPLSEIEPEDCVGVDLGITSYIHTSENLSVDTLDLSDEYDRYAREQRKLDRKEHGSANWEKQRRKVAQAKRTIKRKVLDYQHKLTTWLVTEYDVVAVEDLDVKPMLETSQNGKNKQDAAWSRFLDLLEYKADLHGTHVEKVKPEGTTKECAVCGVETAKPIWVREHSCPACGHTDDRDLNAAKNILHRGLKQLGAGRSESTPVQTALPTFTPQREAVDAKRVVEAGSPGVVRKTSSSVMTRDGVSRTT